MTFSAIGSLTGPQQKTDAGGGVAEAKRVEPSAEQRKVARDFEAIFMRQLLGSMEKAGGVGGSANNGGAMYRSMMVGALADSAAEGGGIGLAELILRAMLPASEVSATLPGAAEGDAEGPPQNDAPETAPQGNAR